MRDVRGRALCLGAAATLQVAMACSPITSPEATTGPSATSGAIATIAPSTGRPAPTADGASIELTMLDPRYVAGGGPVSAAGQVLWTSGEETLSEIWRYVPGGAEPERIFASEHDDASIQAIAASSAGYAFTEQSVTAYGKGGWRLWFLPGAGDRPIEVDRGTAPGSGVAPTIAMDPVRLAWAAFDEPKAGPVSRLRVAPTDNLRDVTTLIEAPIAQRLLWYPELSGDELWFATIKADFDATGVGDEFHIESINLTGPSAAPVRFAGLGNDFNPAVNDRCVVWKTAATGDAALNWGTLHALDRRSGTVATIPIEHANRPSIGDRYVTFEEIFHRRLVVYDPVTSRLLDLAAARTGLADRDATYGGQSLSGRLFTFFAQDGGGPPRIGWAVLPE